MPKKATGRSKKTRAKAKNVTQTVIVNVGKRGGGKAPSAPRPTPLQQALQFIQATRQPQQGESLVQSTQILQRMLEPINRQLQALMIPQAPLPLKGSDSQNPLQASMVQAPMVQAPMVAPIKPFVPFELPEIPLSYHDFVLDLPDAPLVQPPKPLVPAGPLRLDPEYEDVPIEADAKVEERQAPLSFVNYDELLRNVSESQGAEGNKKRIAGQLTKQQLITMVASVTGRNFAPSVSFPYDRIKEIAISFIKDIMKSK